MYWQKSWKQLFISLFSNKSIGRYGLIGFSGVSLDLVIFVLLISLKVTALVASVIGTLAGILNNYFLNAKFNFRVGFSALVGIRFLGVGLTGLFISSLLFKQVIEMGLDPLIGKLVVIPIVVLAQFLVNKYWTFAISRKHRSNLSVDK